MTFSLTGRCARSGMFGIAVTTSSIAVASRCVWARAGIGAVATQNVTNPAIGAMALDMLAVVERFRAETGLSLQMRIGMAAGPVLAGVIGTRKFSYDVWGDAVNLAARLENLGEPGRIHLCPICRERLVHAFEIESRGLTEIRGVGQQETWFLVGIRRCDSASAGQA